MNEFNVVMGVLACGFLGYLLGLIALACIDPEWP